MTRARRGKAPQQERSRATVDAIVEATGQIFEQRGLRGTTTTDVADRAGVSIGSLYQYFPDKQALIAAFFERRVQEDIELMQNVAARAAGATPIGVLRVVAEEFLALFRRDRALYAGVASILPLLERTDEVRRGLERGVTLATAHLRAHPELHGERDPELLAFVMFHGFRSTLLRIVEHDPDRLADPDLDDILVGGALGCLGLPPDAR